MPDLPQNIEVFAGIYKTILHRKQFCYENSQKICQPLGVTFQYITYLTS